MQNLVDNYWSPEMMKEFPMDDYLLELMSIAYSELEDKTPDYLAKMSDRWLAKYLFNKVKAAVLVHDQTLEMLIRESMKIENPGEKQMQQMIARSDSLAEMERVLKEISPEAIEYQDLVTKRNL